MKKHEKIDTRKMSFNSSVLRKPSIPIDDLKKLSAGIMALRVMCSAIALAHDRAFNTFSILENINVEHVLEDNI